jgi:hypothetical protein
MKVVVSISLGSANRNQRTETELFGEHVILERIGFDGDQKRPAPLSWHAMAKSTRLAWAVPI